MGKEFRKITTLLIASAGAMYAYNKVVENKHKNKQILEKENDYYFETKFGKVRYNKYGTNGTPLLLIHNLESGSSSYEFHNVIKKLAETNIIYTVDLLGYGLSDKPQVTYTNYFHVTIIKNFINEIIKENTSIITSGDSSTIAFMLNALDSDCINKLYLINPQDLYKMNFIPSKQNKMMQFIFETPILGTFIYYVLNSKEKTKNKLLDDYFYDYNKVSQNDIDKYYESTMIGGEDNKYTFASVNNYYTNINFLNALKNCKKKITIIAGEQEENINETIKNYEYYNSFIQSNIIKETKKLPHLERPDEVVSIIQS